MRTRTEFLDKLATTNTSQHFVTRYRAVRNTQISSSEIHFEKTCFENHMVW